MGADLHLHSTFSDGRLSPRELVRLGQERGLTLLALTDHDSVNGLAEAWAAGQELALEVWAGVELGCDWQGREVHLLGLGLQNLDPLQEALARLRRGRDDRGKAMVERLQGLGLPITWEEVLAESGGRAVGRPHLARVLVHHGTVRNVDEAFFRYLDEGRPGYVQRYKLSPATAIELIHTAGGLAMLAHPGMGITRSELNGLLALGLDGLEVDHPAHSVVEARYLRHLAASRGLLSTAGTDFHGDGDRRHARFPGDIRLEEPAVLKLRQALRGRRSI